MLFIFDIDETILVCDEPSRVNDMHARLLTRAGYSPYEPLECYVLNKEKIKNIFKEILAQGHEIGFITAGGVTEQKMREFVKVELNINLPDPCIYYNNEQNKAQALKEIALRTKLPKDNIYFIDDNPINIARAREAGFKNTIQVDSDKAACTNGTRYIAELESILSSLKPNKQATACSEEKPAVVESISMATVPTTQTALTSPEMVKTSAVKTSLFGAGNASAATTSQTANNNDLGLC
jgi:hypothetical protein